MSKFKIGDKIREIGYGIESAETRARREREAKAREYAHLMPSPQLIREVEKGMSFGSPGVKEYWNSLLAWSKAHWPWIAGGTILYAGLLVAALRRGK